MAYPPEFAHDINMFPTFYKFIEKEQLLISFWDHIKVDRNPEFKKYSFFEVIKINFLKNVDRDDSDHW